MRRTFVAAVMVATLAMLGGCLPTRAQLETVAAQAQAMADELQARLVELETELDNLEADLATIEDPQEQAQAAALLRRGQESASRLGDAVAKARGAAEAAEARLAELPADADDGDALLAAGAGLATSAGASIGGPVGVAIGGAGVVLGLLARYQAVRQFRGLVAALQDASGPLEGVNMGDREVVRQIREKAGPAVARQVKATVQRERPEAA